jgi:hypothetical protein
LIDDLAQGVRATASRPERRSMCKAMPAMRALSVRQPWAELILRGRKTIECRSRATRIRERVWLYAARSTTSIASLQPPRTPVIDADTLMRGFLVGSVEIVGCRPLRRADRTAACVATDDGGFAWLLAKPDRLAVPLSPTRHPQPVFFYPFERGGR